ncbi:MAG: hypothetical protein LBT59_06360 [Clostridiales bacterium]|jgi:GTPase SAR1 family protein|nr:hypothetical protein [Clostridiales bacterium]
MPSILCPFCFYEFPEGELLYHCLDCGADIKASDLKRSEIAKKAIVCRTPACHARNVYIKHCPYCNNELPEALFDTHNLSFSLIGSSGSGKTNYITVLLNEQSKRSQKLRIHLNPITHETKETFSSNRESIYTKKLPLSATSPGSERPSIWIIGNGNRNLKYLLNIFDGAGETHNDLLSETARRDSRYIEHSKAVIFVIDPLRFTGLRELANNIDPDKSSRSSAFATEEENSAFIIGNTANLLRRGLKIDTNKKIDMNIAIVISKIDLFLEACFQGKTLFNESPHARNGCFTQQDCDEVDRELTDWLSDNGEDEFINALEQNFYFRKSAFKRKKCYLFGISAFGGAPLADGTLPEVHPHRVMDPLLWLLAQQDFIDSR